jgi:hypothetical protein
VAGTVFCVAFLHPKFRILASCARGILGAIIFGVWGKALRRFRTGVSK